MFAFEMAEEEREVRSLPGVPRADAQPAPPFEGMDGYWVEREHFPGVKSFGLFRCENQNKKGKRCSKVWSSAHAQTDFGQGCQKCEAFSKPWLMWWNMDKPKKHDKKNPDDERAAHDRDRCEACRKGVCTIDQVDSLANNLCALAF